VVNNFCEVDSVTDSEASIPEMLISHTDIPFGGNVVSSLFKFHNVPWAHHASV